MTNNDEPDDPDSRLWQAAMQDVKRLRGKAHTASAPTAKGAKKPRGLVQETAIVPPRQKDTSTNTGGTGLDRRTDERLRRGKMDIDGRIDLHGFTQKEARDVLTRELLKFYEQGKRCILVITGQGKEKARENDADWWETKPGLLRRATPEWLKQPPLAGIILQTHAAKQADGGAGAMYVLLRRKREF